MPQLAGTLELHVKSKETRMQQEADQAVETQAESASAVEPAELTVMPDFIEKPLC